MINLKIDSQIDDLKRRLSAIESRQWPFVISQAVNDLAFRLLDKTKRDIPKYIDKPVPFTISSFRIKAKATKSNPIALLEWRDWPGKDLGAGRPMFPQAYGGVRRQKAFERSLEAFGYLPKGWVVIPSSDLPKNAYGNIAGPLFTRILSFLRADRSGTQARPTGKLNARQSRTEKRRASKYFVVKENQVVGSGQSVRLQDGIYERIATGFGAAFRQLFFFQPQARYQITYPVEQLNQDFLNKNTGDAIDKAIQKAIDTTRR